MNNPLTPVEEVVCGYNHVWSATVVEGCSQRERVLRFVAGSDFDAGLAAAKNLLAMKFPNKLKDLWPDCQWHPDYELVAIKRGEELDNNEESL